MTKKKKGILISVISFAVVLAIALPILIINVVKKNKGIDWNGYMISGFSEFSAMGAAVIDESGASSVAYAVGDVAAAANKKGNEDACLVGFKENGTFEKIKFKDENGKLHNQDVKLIHFDVRERFSIVSFSTNKDAKYVDFEYYGYSIGVSDDKTKAINYNIDAVYPIEYESGNRNYSYTDSALFIIDNETGKIYDIEHIVDKLKDSIYEKVGNVGFVVRMVNLNNVYIPFDVDYILLGVEFYTTENIRWLFEISFESENIKLTQRMNNTQFNNFSSVEINSHYVEEMMFSDKFGNVVWRDSSLTVYNYQKKNGLFGQIDVGAANLKLSPNGVFYYQKDSMTYYLNEQGELELITLNELIFDFKETNHKYLYEKNNVIYLAYSTNHGLIKMNLSEENDWEYTLDYVVYNDGVTPDYHAYNIQSKTSVAANDGFIYELTNGVLMKYDIETGTPQTYESQYQFKDLKYNKRLDQVTFKAVDMSTMSEVEGYFDENNEIVLGDFKDVNRGLNKVYVIKPLN